jgi:hypothetical protein
LPSSDCFGLRHVEGGDVLLHGVAVLASDVGVAQQVGGVGGTEEPRPQLGAMKPLREWFAHVGHERIVEELADVDFIIQPAGLRPIVLSDRPLDRLPLSCLIASAPRYLTGRGIALAFTRPRHRPDTGDDHADQRHDHDQQFDEANKQAHPARMPVV